MRADVRYCTGRLRLCGVLQLSIKSGSRTLGRGDSRPGFVGGRIDDCCRDESGTEAVIEGGESVGVVPRIAAWTSAMSAVKESW